MITKRRSSILGAVLLAVLTFSPGCGDGGGDADAAARVEVEAVIQAAFDAWNAKDVEAFRQHFTDEGLLAVIGEVEGTPDEVAAAVSEFIGIERLTLQRFVETRIEDATATTVVVSAFGKGVSKDEFSLINQDGVWKVDGREELLVDVPAGINLVHVDAREFAFDVDTSEIADGNVAFEFANIGGQEHEMLVIRFDREITVEEYIDDLLASESFYVEGVEDTGGKLAAPDETVNLVFSEPLAPGRYALVCTLEDADGTVHARRGMWVEFTVE